MKGAEKILLYKHNIERAQRAHGKSNGRDRKRGRKKGKAEGFGKQRKARKKAQRAKGKKADPAAGTGRKADLSHKTRKATEAGTTADGRAKKEKADLPCLASFLACGGSVKPKAVQPERLPERLQTEGRNTRVINALQTAGKAPGKHTTRGKDNCYNK